MSNKSTYDKARLALSVIDQGIREIGTIRKLYCKLDNKKISRVQKNKIEKEIKLREKRMKKLFTKAMDETFEILFGHSN